jgi:hypothetical protein
VWTTVLRLTPDRWSACFHGQDLGRRNFMTYANAFIGAVTSVAQELGVKGALKCTSYTYPSTRYRSDIGETLSCGAINHQPFAGRA